MGRPFGSYPTLDKAMANARQGRGESVADSVNSGLGTPPVTAGANLRYLTDVSTEHEGFNAGVVAKTCLIVKGMGYK